MRARRRASSLEARPQQQGWSEQPPPVADPAHLRVTLPLVIANRARMLDDLEASERLVQHVRLEIVAIEPGLPDVDLGIGQDRRLENPEPIRGVRNPAKDEQAEQEGIDARSERATATVPQYATTRHPARSLDVVGARRKQGIQGPRPARPARAGRRRTRGRETDVA